ncbi:hypothetical protein MMC26_001175 [Xylographa opegraphella]|nr:hypothetical protein [Xylographa opegraphella]
MAISSRDRAWEYVSRIEFHQSFILSANAEAGRPSPIRITYSDLDYRLESRRADGPVVLVVGGMFGGRYMSMGSWDGLARKHRLRCVVPDKFGMGGSGAVPLEYRIQAWLDMVPALLAHLHVKHVAIITHSNGTIYTLNTLLKSRHILHPTKPFVAFLAPWVHPSHSGSLTALSLVPEGVLNIWPSIAKFVNTKVAPVFMFSGQIVSGITKSTLPDAQLESFSQNDYDPELRAIFPDLERLVPKLFMEENISGGADEAFLSLKRGDKCTWGLFADTDEAISMVVSQERELALAASSSPNGDSREKLRTAVFFAESDIMIGKKGQEWFGQCWRNQDIADLISYTSETVPNSSHETIGGPAQGVFERLFEEIALSFG